MGRAFFANPRVREAIDVLGSAPDFRIVVGAGASRESGLPLWEELVDRLLADAASAKFADPILRADFQAEVRGRESRLGAATIARQALGSAFEERLQENLYRHPDDDDARSGGPGPLARAVGRAYRVFDGDCRVTTTNYDLFLEEAIGDEIGQSVEPCVAPDEPPARCHVVRHAHGFLPEAAPGHGVVLTEAEYHLTADDRSWQEQHFTTIHRSAHVLYVGTSMTDPNMLRFLYRHPPRARGRVFLILLRPDLKSRADVPVPRGAAEEHHEAMSAKRWRALKVEVLFADHHAQVSQFLFEVAYRRAVGDAYVRYGQRLDRWFRAIADPVLGLADRELFEKSQEEHSQLGRTWLDGIRAVARSTLGRTTPNGEVMAVHFWYRCPETMTLGPLPGDPIDLSWMTMGLCSDRTWWSPEAADRRFIMRPTHRAAIEAFCFGVPRVHEFQVASHQWNFVLAFPVIIDDHSLGRLPVGAITVASNIPGGRSTLARLRASSPQRLQRMGQYLQEQAASVLNPVDVASRSSW